MEPPGGSSGVSYWLGEPAVAELWPDGRLVVDHGGGYICTSVVTRAKPGSTLAMSWRFPDEPDRAVTFETGDGPDSEGCVLDLTHTGLGDLAASYRIGWLVHLTYLEAAVHGTPLPLDQFWNLHATFAALHL